MKQLARLPRDHQVQVGRAIDQMSDDPFAGVGRYRVIFSVNQEAKLVEIAAILPRSEKTYK